MKKFIVISLILVVSISTVFSQCVNCDPNNTASGLYSAALGNSTTASGNASFAAGANSIASGSASFALGLWNISDNSYSISIGSFGKASANNSMVIGHGYGDNFYLTNSISYSLAIGFNSNVPSMFIGPSEGPGFTGRIGIGNITAPEAKLHLLADEGEEAAIFIQPHNWANNEPAILMLGSRESGITANTANGMSFLSEGNYLFNSGGFVGINTANPEASLHVKDGDIYLEDINRGIIMKSPDGRCWRGQLNDDGMLNFSVLENCPGSSSSVSQTNINSKNIKVFPNPTKDFFNIEIKDNTDKLELHLISNEGVVMKTKSFKGASTRIYVGDIATGTYFIKVFGKTLNYSITVTVL